MALLDMQTDEEVREMHISAILTGIAANDEQPVVTPHVTPQFKQATTRLMPDILKVYTPEKIMGLYQGYKGETNPPAYTLIRHIMQDFLYDKEGIGQVLDTIEQELIGLQSLFIATGRTVDFGLAAMVTDNYLQSEQLRQQEKAALKHQQETL